jgi:hypothetical protein
MSKQVGRAISDDIWSASINRPSHKIYEKDRIEQKERSRNWQPDSLQINADRIKKGQPVSEDYLWGKLAMKMIRGCLVSEETLDAYRKQFLIEYQKLYSEHDYQIKLKTLTDKHEEAREISILQ